MAKIYRQDQEVIWSYSATMSNSAMSGSIITKGANYLFGMVYAGCPLSTACAIRVYQAAGSGQNYDYLTTIPAVSACSGSIFKFPIVGTTADILVTPGTCNVNPMRMEWYLMPIDAGQPQGGFMGNVDGASAVLPFINARGDYLFNGTTWDRQRGNIEATLLASAKRTATTCSLDQTNYNGAGHIFIITSCTTAASVTPSLQLKDSISGGYVTIWTAASNIDTDGTFTYQFVPGGAAGSYTESVNLRLSRTWRMVFTAADTASATYSVSVNELV